MALHEPLLRSDDENCEEKERRPQSTGIGPVEGGQGYLRNSTLLWMRSASAAAFFEFSVM